ncbi:MAG: glycosyltransferase family 4 protein [Calditrichota bacterium]
MIRLRIAWLQPNLHWTGGARVAVELGRRLNERGHAVTILTPRGRVKMPIPSGLEVRECGMRTAHPLAAVFTGLAGMAVNLPKVDVLIASMPPLALAAFWLARMHGARSVNYLLGDDVHIFDDGVYIKQRGLRAAYRMIARSALRTGPVIVNSHWTAVRCMNEGGPRPLAIIPSGFDPNIFFPLESTVHSHEGGSGRPALPRPRDSHWRLVAVARHLPAKGLPDLIAGLNLIDQLRYPFKIKIISQDQLELSAARFPWEIIKPSSDEELAGHYRWGEIFVHASWAEGFGLPPLEAQACGLAVVATDSGGVCEYLRDEENALIISPREPASIARAIVRFMKDDSLARRLIDRGLKTCQDFTWDQAAIKMERFLLDFAPRRIP